MGHAPSGAEENTRVIAVTGNAVARRYQRYLAEGHWSAEIGFSRSRLKNRVS